MAGRGELQNLDNLLWQAAEFGNNFPQETVGHTYQRSSNDQGLSIILDRITALLDHASWKPDASWTAWYRRIQQLFQRKYRTKV